MNPSISKLSQLFPDSSKRHYVSATLPSLLLAEQLSGRTNEQDPAAKRPDFFYFNPSTHVYVIVEDHTKQHRPILIHQWEKPKKGLEVKEPWPVIWGGVEGKSAFAMEKKKKEDDVVSKRREEVARDRRKKKRVMLGKRMESDEEVIGDEESGKEDWNELNAKQSKSAIKAKVPNPFILQSPLKLRESLKKEGNTASGSHTLNRTISLVNLKKAAWDQANHQLESPSSTITKLPPISLETEGQDLEFSFRNQGPFIPQPKGNHTLPGNPNLNKSRTILMASGNSVIFSTIASGLSAVTSTQSGAIQGPMMGVGNNLNGLRGKEIDFGFSLNKGKKKSGNRIEALMAAEGKQQGRLKRSASHHEGLKDKFSKEIAPREKEKVKKPGYCENCKGRYEDFNEVSFYEFDEKSMNNMFCFVSLAHCLKETSKVRNGS
jgi:hypothetical protein